MIKVDIKKRKIISSMFVSAEGFSLIEVLLAMVIGTMVMSALYVSIMEGHRASTGIEQKISAQQDVRAALDIMAMEVTLASLNPTGGSGLWLNTNCGPGGTPANKGIQIAAANQIAIEMDLNADGVISAPNEVITYNYDAPNQQITRGTGCAAAQPFLGDSGAPSNTARNVRVINNALGIPMFQYFDGNGAQFIPNAATTIQNIRKIRITIAVQAASPDIQGQSRRLIYSSDVIPRNHVIPASLP